MQTVYLQFMRIIIMMFFISLLIVIYTNIFLTTMKKHEAVETSNTSEKEILITAGNMVFYRYCSPGLGCNPGILLDRNILG